MNYTINSIRQENEILITNTTITLEDGTDITIDISHYMPQSFNDINIGIVNRAISEQAKINTINNLTTLIETIPTGTEITI